MKSNLLGKPVAKTSNFGKILALFLIFAVTFSVVFISRKAIGRHSDYTDGVADSISEEMSGNHIILSSDGGRRTAADFSVPIITDHGKDTRLIVYTARLSETVSVSSEGLMNWSWTSSYKDIYITGEAEYTVDLSRLSERDFTVNNELKTLTVRIPYAVLSSLSIPPEQMKFGDVKKGSWVAPKEISMTPEESSELLVNTAKIMKAKLIDDNILSLANANAKTVVAGLLSAAVTSVDPEFTVVIVQ